MITIAIQGTYRVKFAFDLLGRRVTLWSKSGAFNEKISIAKGLRASRRHDFGPFELAATIDGSALTVSATVCDGRIALWSHSWPISEVLAGKKSQMSVKAKGLETQATIRLMSEGPEAA